MSASAIYSARPSLHTIPPVQPAIPGSSRQLERMRISGLFAGLSPRDCSEILSRARTRTFGRDELLFSQGEQARHLIWIESGSAKLSQLSSSGNEVILWMVGGGEALGLNGNTDHTCSARAMQDCKVLIWDARSLQELVTLYPQLRTNLGTILFTRLAELEERFREIATERVSKRIARTLSRLVQSVGTPTSEGIEVSLSREELAQMTGTTLFTVSRTLSKWADSGLVVPRREAVVIRNSSRLAQVTEEEE